MGVRAKLLLPLLTLVIVIIVAVEFIWLPELAARAEAEHVERQATRLEVLGIALLNPMLADDLAQTRLILDAVLEKYPEWVRLDLKTAKGKRLYPAGDFTDAANGEHIHRRTQEIKHLDNTLGTLFLTADLGGFVAEFEHRFRVLDWLMLVMLPLLAGGGALLQERYLRRPLHELAAAATRIAHGNYNVQLPRPGNDEVGRLIHAFGGICEMRNSAERALETLAYYDMLTHLPNRVMLKEHLTLALANAGRTGCTLSLLFIDLDRFKVVNDTLGHDVGDRLLAEAAERIKNCVRAGDFVARLGGDEFTVVLEEKSGHAGSRIVARYIIEALEQPFVFGGQKLVISPSIGISLFPDHATDYGAMVQCADTAMYRAKAIGGNGYRYYSPEMGDSLSQHMNIEAGLRRALAEEEFILHFQPKVELDSGRITGVEAMIRWMDPEKGLVLPDDFIPLAEETGLIIPIGEWVLRRACEQYAEWGAPDIELAINLSANHLYHPGLFAMLRTTLEETGFAAERLEIEITENAIMQNAVQTTTILEKIKALGIKVAIDDFGTGYSSLTYLKRFAIDTIKIDRSFVKDLPHNADDVAITSATVAMARALNRRLVAEGIENAGQAAFLHQLGCRLGQGYYYSKPLASAELAAMLRNNRYLNEEHTLDQQPRADRHSAPPPIQAGRLLPGVRKMEIELYYTPLTRSSRPRWLLEELALPYRLRPVDLFGSEYNPLHSLGCAPAISINGQPMVESGAICNWLADCFPEKDLSPASTDPRRARYEQWMFFVAATLDPPAFAILMHTQILPKKKRVDAIVPYATRCYQRLLRMLEKELDHDAFLLGRQFTCADIMLATTLTCLPGILEAYPSLQAYAERATDRPAYRRSIEPVRETA